MKLLNRIFGWHGIESSHRLMLLIVLTLGLLNFFWGEKVTAGGGFGWDGVYYAEMVRHLDTMISNGELGSYYMQRILPAASVRSLLLITGIPLNSANIIGGFEFYNLVILVIICLSWKRISDKLQLSLGGRWLGFSGIFINFECSKQAFFYPVLTDVTALLIGVLLLLFYIEKKPLLIFIVSVFGAFCWPVVSVSGALLILFLKTVLPDDVISPQTSTFSVKSVDVIKIFKIIFFCVFVLCLLSSVAIIFYIPVSGDACRSFVNTINELSITMPAPLFIKVQNFINSVDSCLLDKLLIKVAGFLTATPSILALFIALFILTGSNYFFKFSIKNISNTPWYLLILAIATVLFPALLVKIFANPSVANPSSLLLLLRLMLFPQEGKFFLPLVSLVSFWGPVFLLVIILWKEFCIEVRKLGPGVVAVISIALILGLVGEPRFLTIGWPFFVLVLVLLLEKVQFKPAFKPVFIILTIIYAQFWLKLNYEPWMPPDGEGLQDFPKQLYFMHYGLWMSWMTYLLQFSLITISAFALKATIIKIK